MLTSQSMSEQASFPLSSFCEILARRTDPPGVNGKFARIAA